MQGWHISVYRLPDDAPTPPGLDALVADRIAVWQAGVKGLDWLDDLVRRNRALLLGGNGYPSKYAAQAKYLLGQITAGPPSANPRWHVDPGDILTSEWVGRTLVDKQLVEQCHPDEWLVVEVWDES